MARRIITHRICLAWWWELLGIGGEEGKDENTTPHDVVLGVTGGSKLNRLSFITAF